MVRYFLKWWREMNRPMTLAEERRMLDWNRAICGCKRCPHCGEWIRP